ncbi:uncharacterized protein N7511_011405 [Penicillium nucicola]|uniref:uncharacterized protein n=1 Tax=Penicillium nucicola TaxID=1850975 RepID=UPI00254544BB|nr:uncharacterized protein N7511_011405 [Penicillium nucicola]KAJ5742386.1 hypothetical protein N7511_011405 [Penicillium nucicola]
MATLIYQFFQTRWVIVLPTTVLLLVGAVTTIGLTWLLQAAFFQRKLLLDERLSALNEDKEFIGKPLLFPTKLSHSRMFPERYNYTYDYFLVGIPVSLRGRVGSILSIDTAQPAPDDPNKSTRSTKCWFKVDQRHYLEPGNSTLGLQGKLKRHLLSRGENPQQWPYAYMISIPKFLWFTRNAVSWWLLYNPSRELDAMVMEVNNSFGERKAAFFRLNAGSAGTDANHTAEIMDSVPFQTCSGLQHAKFVASASQFKMYKGNWDKDFFLSPFEKVEGYFTTTCSDPCNPFSGTKGPLHSNTTLYAPDGRPKIISRLFSCGEPLDPLRATPWQLMRFICRWGYIGALSKQRIIYEALRVRFRGNLTYLRKPEVKNSNIPREETALERQVSLEKFFRLFLVHVVAHYPKPLKVIYEPSKSHWLFAETFHSPSSQLDLQKSLPELELTVRVLSPAFYTNVLQYEDPAAGLDKELTPLPLVADSNSQYIWTSDTSPLKQICSSKDVWPETTPTPKSRLHRVREALIHLSRNSSTPTFMDRFVNGYLDPAQQKAYQVAVARYLLAERYTFGSHLLLRLCENMAIIFGMWVLIYIGGHVLHSYGSIPVERVQIATGVCAVLFGGAVRFRNAL